MTDSLSAAEARRMTLGAQGFSRRRPPAAQVRHLHTAMHRLGVLQIDSVNVFARAHYMPLYARLGAYDPSLLDRTFLSGGGRYVEYLAHEATFVPVADWALWDFRMQDYRRRYGHAWLEGDNARTLAWVRDELAARGPSRPVDIRGDAPKNRGRSTFAVTPRRTAAPGGTGMRSSTRSSTSGASARWRSLDDRVSNVATRSRRM